MEINFTDPDDYLIHFTVLKNTKVIIVPHYRMGRQPSRHKSKKAAKVKIQQLLNDHILFSVLNENGKPITLKEVF